MDLRHCIVTLALILGCFQCYGQDEGLFRELYLYADRQKAKTKVEKNYRLKARSNRHLLDLTGDSRPESFYAAKLDGEDWFFLFDQKGKEVLKYRLDNLGPWSRLFRIQKRKISKESYVYLLYFYEGVTRYLNFKGTSRVYFLTVDRGEIKTAKIYKGPVFWDESRDFRDHYHQRKYDISLYDLDGDRTREITVKYGRMSRVYKYLGEGKWRNFDDQEAL